MQLTVQSLIRINNIITGLNYITLRKVNVNLYEFNKLFMGKDLIEDNLYQIIDQVNERNITPINFYAILINKIHPLYDRNGRTCKVLCVRDDKMNELIDETQN